MSYAKFSAAVLFLMGYSFFNAQNAKKDTIKESKIDGIQIKGNTSKKTEAAVLLEQKKATVQKQALSAQEISRKGISNVEQGLTKITGITSVEGRGLFVRGLEERYNYLLINGLGSPSNNPFQKIIALKQFPTDVVGKLNIYKTFNSNLYGDFAGATFDIETVGVEKPFSKVEFGVSVNSISTFRDNFLVAENAQGINGYLGLNSRDRKLPIEVRNDRPNGYVFSKEQSLNSFKDSWNVDNTKSLPNTSIGFTTSQSLNAGENAKLGFLFSLNQANKYRYREGQNNQFIPNGNTIDFNNILFKKDYEYETETSSLLALNYKRKNTNILLNTIYLQNATNSIEDFLGYKNLTPNDIRFFRTNQQDVSRFLDLQLIANHKITDRHQIKAGGSYVLNNYSQPDRKIFELRAPNDYNNAEITFGGNNFIRQYLDVNSKFYGSAFGEYSILLGNKQDRNEFPYHVAIGYNGFADIRETSYRFIFGNPGTTNSSVFINVNQPQNIINQSIQNEQLYYNEGSDKYNYLNNIYQFINAGYLNFNYKPNDTWDILLGGRFENDIRILRFNAIGDSNTQNIINNKNYILPSLSIKKAINSKNNLRFSASKTITRPVLIEKMPIEYINPDNTNILGNPNLQNSENYNLDLKWEFFPTNKELFAVNVFGKLIENAIERSFVTTGNSNGITVTFYNAVQAKIGGVELEGILNLGRISSSLERFTLGTNATIMYTNVERSEQQLRLEKPDAANYTGELRERGLQGAAPYTINADLKYEHKNKNNFSKTYSLVYNVSGSKIYGVGTSGADHFFERPFHQLDFVYQNQINKNWNIKLAIQNILNSEYKIELGKNSYYFVNNNNNFVLNNFFNGTNYNFSVGYTF